MQDHVGKVSMMAIRGKCWQAQIGDEWLEVPPGLRSRVWEYIGHDVLAHSQGGKMVRVFKQERLPCV